jgi:hypothetical protein
MNRFILSADLGEVSDWSAYSILDERVSSKRQPDPIDLTLGMEGRKLYSREYLLRYLRRPALGTTYPEVVRQLQDLVGNPALKGNVDLVVDATGVGRPVIEVMQEAYLHPIPVVITFGQSCKEVTMGDDGYYRVPKVDLMASLNVLFGSHRLLYPASLPDQNGINLVPVWIQEMEQFKLKRTKANNLTYEAWRETDHDDIVLSLALGAWWALFSRPKEESLSAPDVVEEEEYNPHKMWKSARR